MDRSLEGPPRLQVALAVVGLVALLAATVAAAAWAGGLFERELERERIEQAAPEPDVVAQEQADTAFPVKLDTYSGQYQAVAQTFTAPQDRVALAQIAPYVSYTVGDRAILEVRRLERRRDPVSGSPLASATLDLFGVKRGAYHTVDLSPPIPMKPGGIYSFVVRVERRSDEIGIGGTSHSDTYPGGEAWYYTRQFGGNGELISDQHAWTHHHSDLQFKLLFVPLAAETTA